MNYVVVWFEGESVFTLVGKDSLPVLISKEQTRHEPSIHGVLETEDDVENANDDMRYAMKIQLLEDLYGYVFQE